MSLHKLIVHTGGNITYVEFNLLSFSQAVNGSSILGLVPGVIYVPKAHLEECAACGFNEEKPD